MDAVDKVSEYIEIEKVSPAQDVARLRDGIYIAQLVAPRFEAGCSLPFCDTIDDTLVLNQRVSVFIMWHDYMSV